MRRKNVKQPGGERLLFPSRTSRINGGGIQGGAVYRSSDNIGAYPETNPVTPGDLAATLFTHFGIDPGHEIHDITGRPYPLANRRALGELFG